MNLRSELNPLGELIDCPFIPKGLDEEVGNPPNVFPPNVDPPYTIINSIHYLRSITKYAGSPFSAHLPTVGDQIPFEHWD